MKKPSRRLVRRMGSFLKRRSSESARAERAERRREQARQGLALLPSMLTLGNLVCGFAAIVKVATIKFAENGAITPEGQSALFWAGFLIMAGMVFDALDGRVARLTKSTSDFGAELDSLCDAITFGLTPGMIVVLLNSVVRFPSDHFWGKAAWVFGVAYACGAILRLARFNVENTHEEDAHNMFKGLPTPAAAGVIASLVMLQNFLLGARAQSRLYFIPEELRVQAASLLVTALPFVALYLGYLMISRHNYVHVMNVYVRGRFRFEQLGPLLLAGALGAFVIVLLPELVAVLAFGGYALSGPIGSLRNRADEAPAGDAPESSPGEGSIEETKVAPPDRQAAGADEAEASAPKL